jgi:hypothetical protein
MGFPPSISGECLEKVLTVKGVWGGDLCNMVGRLPARNIGVIPLCLGSLMSGQGSSISRRLLWALRLEGDNCDEAFKLPSFNTNSLYVSRMRRCVAVDCSGPSPMPRQTAIASAELSASRPYTM